MQREANPDDNVTYVQWWEETETERGYLVHRARCLLELLPISRAFAAVCTAVSIPTYLPIPRYLKASIHCLPTVELVSLTDGLEGGLGKGKRKAEEDEEDRDGVEEKAATLKYVLHDLASELYIELMEGFYK
jgi:hypothetical protein